MGDMPEVMTVMQGGVECTETDLELPEYIIRSVVGRKAWVSLMHYAWLDTHKAPQRDQILSLWGKKPCSSLLNH